MSLQFQARKAIHIGRQHLINFTNCQDACFLYQGEFDEQPLIIGIICDGCSEGEASEVGARLASEFLIREALHLFQKSVPVEVIPGVLYSTLVEFLRNQVHAGHAFFNSQDQVNFIKNNLLFTVVGIIATPSKCVVFITGDGTIVINDEVIIVDANNTPSYPAYHLVDRSKLNTNASELPTSFDIYDIDMETIGRVAIGSDAWHHEQDLLEEQIWGFKNSAGLQRKINVWSKSEKRFSDDVSIITVELIRPTVESELTAIDTEQQNEVTDASNS